MLGVACWSLATIVARPLLSRWPAFEVTGIPMALHLAYAIWFSAAQRLGGPRTSVYSNLVPVAGLLVASFGFGDHVGVVKGLGAVIVLIGVGLTSL